MEEKEKLVVAQEWVKKLANGINPLNGNAVKEDDIVNNVHICYSFQYINSFLSGFSEKLDELGVDRYSVIFPFADHGCDSDNTIECQTWRQKTLEWFEKYCNQA